MIFSHVWVIVDHTLELLYNSAISRGLPHQVTENLGHITGVERSRIVSAISKLPKWQPQAPSIPEVPKPLTQKQLKTLEAKREQDQFKENAMGALSQVIRMAEASAGLTLGRTAISIRRWRQ
jgi:hypothetical protein